MEPEDANKISAISAAVYTVITFFILLAAVFQAWIHAFLFRPKLRLSILLESPDCQKTFIAPPRADDGMRRLAELDRQYHIDREAIIQEGRVRSEFQEANERLTRLFDLESRWAQQRRDIEEEALIDGYYFRIRLHNSGRGKAEQAEVFALELSRRERDGSYLKVDKFVPINLCWSHLGQAFYPFLSPGMEKPCDLGFIIDPRRRSEADNRVLGANQRETVFTFSVQVTTHAHFHTIMPGVYRLVLLVAASNSKPTKFTLEIDLSGRWFNDIREMLGQGIRIALIP